MQIILNALETQEAVVAHVRDLLLLDNEANIVVEVNEDGTSTVLVNEDAQDAGSEGNAPATEKPAKRARRTKAQIEADNKAEEERRLTAQAEAAAGNEEPTPTTSAEAVKPSEPAPVEDAGATTQPEPENPGQSDEQPESQSNEASTSDSPGTAEPEAEVDPEPEVQSEAAEAETPATKPAGVSLFANLRRPNNTAG